MIPLKISGAKSFIIPMICGLIKKIGIYKNEKQSFFSYLIYKKSIFDYNKMKDYEIK